jgi:hypothetical protein
MQGHASCTTLRLRVSRRELHAESERLLRLLTAAPASFHPRGQAYVPFNDKVLHFVCFLAATALFYMIWDVDEVSPAGVAPARLC